MVAAVTNEARRDAVTSLIAIALSRAAPSAKRAVALERELRVYADVREDRGVGR